VFHHAILLWGVWHGQLTPHPRRHVVLGEVDRDEFPTAINVKTPQLLPGRYFHLSLHLLDCFRYTIFRWEENDPQIHVEIIDHQ
jgi:hypothetical protein